MVNEIIACHEIVYAWKKNKKIKKTLQMKERVKTMFLLFPILQKVEPQFKRITAILYS